MGNSNEKFDFETYLLDVLSENTLYQSHALWLEGFSKILSDLVLDSEKVSNYARFSFRNNSFDKIINPNFYKGHIKLIEDEILKPYYIRIDDNYHLALWMIPISKKEGDKIIYDEDYCKINFHHPYEKGITDSKYPSIDLRLNNHVQSEKHPDFIEFNEELYNRYNAFRKTTPFEVLLQSYECACALRDYSVKKFDLDSLIKKDTLE
jgi:hypothetical protein